MQLSKDLNLNSMPMSKTNRASMCADNKPNIADFEKVSWHHGNNRSSLKSIRTSINEPLKEAKTPSKQSGLQYSYSMKQFGNDKLSNKESPMKMQS